MNDLNLLNTANAGSTVNTLNIVDTVKEIGDKRFPLLKEEYLFICAEILQYIQNY